MFYLKEHWPRKMFDVKVVEVKEEVMIWTSKDFYDTGI